MNTADLLTPLEAWLAGRLLGDNRSFFYGLPIAYNVAEDYYNHEEMAKHISWPNFWDLLVDRFPKKLESKNDPNTYSIGCVSYTVICKSIAYQGVELKHKEYKRLVKLLQARYSVTQNDAKEFLKKVLLRFLDTILHS